MKGQAENISGSIAAIIVVSIFVIVGALVYGYVADVVPHDEWYSGELLCIGNGTAIGVCNVTAGISIDNTPIQNGSEVVYISNSSATLTAGTDYNVVTTSTINITNGSIDAAEDWVYINYYEDVVSDVRQSSWTSVNATSYSGFGLLSVAIIVMAAVAIVGLVFLIRRD